MTSGSCGNHCPAATTPTVLGVEEVLVVGHRDCGMAHLDGEDLRRSMLERGVPAEAIDGVDNLSEWLGGFANPTANVEKVVERIRSSPLVPDDVPVHGLIMEPQRGALTLLVDGYEHGRRSDGD